MAERYNIRMCCTLYVSVLLFLSAGCDWVEISQNHYRNQPTRSFTKHGNTEESSTAVAVYRDHSILDKHKKKGVVDRVQSVASVKRVHIPSVKTPSIQNDEILFNGRFGQEKWQSYGTAEPNLLSKYHEEDLPPEPEMPYHTNRDKSLEKNSSPSTFHKAHIKQTNKINRAESTHKPFTTIESTEEEMSYSQTMSSIRSHTVKYFEKIVASTDRTPQTTYQETLTRSSDDGGEEYETEKRFLTNRNNRPLQSAINISQEKTTQEQDSKYQNISKDGDNREFLENLNNRERVRPNSEITSEKTKSHAVNTVWRLLKVVTDAISASTKRGFKSKTNYLEDLKTKLLSSIEDQVERAWPEDVERAARRARDAGRGHVEFPSSESALMSISFLTFAVFLIKLVLQVIHTYKNKTMMVTPAVVTAVGRAAASMKSKTP